MRLLIILAGLPHQFKSRKIIISTKRRLDKLHDNWLHLCFSLAIQFPYCHFLVLMKIVLKLCPTVNIDSIISIRFKDFHFSIESDYESNVIIFAISNKPLDSTLSICGGHEDKVTCFSAFQELFLSDCVLFLIKVFFRLHKYNFGRVNMVLYYTTYIVLPSLNLLLTVSLKNYWISKLLQSHSQCHSFPSDGSS